MNNFNNATHITCANGLAVPVNKFNQYIDGTRLENYECVKFHVWLSQQPELYTDAPDGTYPVDKFGEVVWQFKTRHFKIWHDAPKSAYVMDIDYKIFEDRFINTDTETRQFIPYIWAKKQESEVSISSNTVSKNNLHTDHATPEQKGVDQGEGNKLIIDISIINARILQLKNEQLNFHISLIEYKKLQAAIDELELLLNYAQ